MGSTALGRWIRDHDESWIFVVGYLGLAVVLSVLVSLFWLLVIVALHLILELLRQAHYRDGAKDVVLHALWEIKLDVGLIVLALTLALYIDVILGVLGLQSAARAAAVTRVGSRIGARAAAWERGIRTFLLTVDEIARIGQAAVVMRRKGRGTPGGTGARTTPGTEPPIDPAAAPTAEASPSPTPPNAPWRAKWGVGDHFGIHTMMVGVILILAAPLLTQHDWGSVVTALVQELRPFRS